MGEQVEALEDDADFAPQGVDVDALPADPVAVEADDAAVDGLQLVDAAQQRRLAAAGRADQTDHLVQIDIEIDTAQHRVRAERLVHVTQLEK